jgi:thioredoxin 1
MLSSSPRLLLRLPTRTIVSRILQRPSLQQRTFATDVVGGGGQVFNLNKSQAEVEAFVADPQKDSPAILYYTARWCPPCQKIKPYYAELAEAFPHVRFGLIDVDDNGEAAAAADITSVPTFVSSSQQRFAGADITQLTKMVQSLHDGIVSK